MDFKCRTCLVLLNIESNNDLMHRIDGDDEIKLRDLINDWRNAEPECVLEQDLPQHICHECYEVASSAAEFRRKVELADQSVKLEASYMNGTGNQQRQGCGQIDSTICCRICMKEFPQSVKSLTCQIRDSPHVKEWLEWLTTEHKLNDDWYENAVICRFCYTKLRDCYEWYLAAEECGKYLKDLWQKHYMPNENDHNCGSWRGINENYLANSDHSSVTTNQDGYNMMGYYEFNGVNRPMDKMNEFTGIYDNVGDGQCFYSGPLLDLYCNLCYTTFSNSILYERHDCTSKNVFSETMTTSPVAYQNDNNGIRGIFATYEGDNSQSGVKLECPQCAKRFTKTILLEAHVLKVHEGKKKPFLCKFCTHAYITHTHLKRHQKSAHKMEWLKDSEDSSSQHNLLDL